MPGTKRSAMDQVAFAKALAAAKAGLTGVGCMRCLTSWTAGWAAKLGTRSRARGFSSSAPRSRRNRSRTRRFIATVDCCRVTMLGSMSPRLGSSVADFHQACADRLATFPDAMLATATHDHKRGEDLRARLAVISEIPDEWAAFLANAVRSRPSVPTRLTRSCCIR